MLSQAPHTAPHMAHLSWTKVRTRRRPAPPSSRSARPGALRAAGWASLGPTEWAPGPAAPGPLAPPSHPHAPGRATQTAATGAVVEGGEGVCVGG